MEMYLGWFQNPFDPFEGPTTAHEYQGYHVNLEDCLTHASCLVCKIVHIGHQANAFAAEKFNDWSHICCTVLVFYKNMIL